MKLENTTVIMIAGSRTKELKNRDVIDDYIKRDISATLSMYEKDKVIIISGGASSGADAIAQSICLELGHRFEVYKPDFSKGYAAYKYFERNHRMVDRADVIYVYWDENSSGTKDVITYAKKLEKKGIKKKLYVITFRNLLDKYQNTSKDGNISLDEVV